MFAHTTPSVPSTGPVRPVAVTSAPAMADSLTPVAHPLVQQAGGVSPGDRGGADDGLGHGPRSSDLGGDAPTIDGGMARPRPTVHDVLERSSFCADAGACPLEGWDPVATYLVSHFPDMSPNVVLVSETHNDTKMSQTFGTAINCDGDVCLLHEFI